MRTTLIALHGLTLNGAAMHAHLGPLAQALEETVDLVCLDAPNECSPGMVDRLYERWAVPRLPPPYLAWWDATADGSIYEGWEATRALAREWLERHQPIGVLGFSQGAMAAAAIAAAAAAGALPPVSFAVIIAGDVPRADAIRPLFDTPVQVPSLHVWGERDTITGQGSPRLVERFDAAGRESLTWPGAHVIPARGLAAKAIAAFVEKHASMID